MPICSPIFLVFKKSPLERGVSEIQSSKEKINGLELIESVLA